MQDEHSNIFFTFLEADFFIDLNVEIILID